MKQDSENHIFYQMMPRFCAWFLLIYALCFAIWTVFYTETGNGDNVEHIHATWLVAYGKVPYRDFFQHHNPLLWYIFAPFMKIITNLLTLLDFAHAVGIIAGLLTFFTVYRLCTRFFASSFASLLSLLVLCPPYYYIYCFNYNPDTFMALFFAVGLYFLFSFFEKRSLALLCLSFEAFFLSFLFTQKILIVLAFLGLICFYVFYLKKTPLSDVLYAVLLPLMSLLLFISLLYHADALKLYWLSNYPFNVIMQKYYGYKKIDVVDYKVLIFSVSLSVISIICCLRKSGLFYKIIAVLFILELPLRCFYFSIAPYYMLPLMIYACCLNGELIDKMLKKYFVFSYLLIAVSGYYAYISVPKYLAARGDDRRFARYLSQNTTPCDYVLSGYYGNQSINTKDPHYYWAMLGHIDIAGEEAGIAKRPDVNELVSKYKPKLVFADIYWDSYELHRGRNVAIQQISPELIRQYYLPTPFPPLYILSYEYRKNNCVYNTQTKEWNYAD